MQSQASAAGVAAAQPLPPHAACMAFPNLLEDTPNACKQVSWDVKGQLQVLRRSRRHRAWLELADPLVDVRIAAWLNTPNDDSTVGVKRLSVHEQNQCDLLLDMRIGVWLNLSACGLRVLWELPLLSN